MRTFFNATHAIAAKCELKKGVDEVRNWRKMRRSFGDKPLLTDPSR
jgi:hypothetical protein